MSQAPRGGAREGAREGGREGGRGGRGGRGGDRGTLDFKQNYYSESDRYEYDI